MEIVETTITKPTIKAITATAPALRPTTDVTIDKLDAQKLGNQYLTDVLSPNFYVSNGFPGNGLWYFLIRYKDSIDREPIGTGTKLVIDSQQHSVIPLTDEQIRDILETLDAQRANASGALARDAEGHILRYQARGSATDYLRDYLSIHYSAIGGLLVPFPKKPVWQFTIRFRMASMGEIEPLGIIDVDARTGEVIPLEVSQRGRILDRVNAIIQYRQLAST